MKTRILTLAMILSLMIVSCTKKDSEDNTTVSEDEININYNIDAAADDISNVLEEQLLLTNNDGLGRGTAAIFAGCATITRTPAAGTTPIIGSTVSKVIDFGMRCEQPNGNVLSGKINMSFIYNPSAPVQVVTYIFENFFHNARKFNGQKTFTRSMTATSASNPTSNPIVVMTMDMLITLPDGRTFTRVGTRTREMTAGFGTIALNDNEFKITGEWTTTYPNTSVQTSTIVNPLLIKYSCATSNSALVSQGIINFVRNSNNATLDYGNGNCDNEAVFTLNGVSRTITLRR